MLQISNMSHFFLSDGLSGMTKALPNLAQQGAVFVGEGAAMPARIRNRDLTEDKLPKSETAKFARGWSVNRLSESEIEATLALFHDILYLTPVNGKNSKAPAPIMLMGIGTLWVNVTT